MNEWGSEAQMMAQVVDDAYQQHLPTQLLEYLREQLQYE